MHLRTAAAALSALLFSAACSRDLDTPPPPQDTGFFTGRAVEPIAGTDQTQPVAGAIVAVPGTNLHAVSDAAGSFTVGPLPVGSYKLLFTLRTSTGAVRQRLLSGVQVQRGGATATLGDVPLHQNAQLAGRALLNGANRGNAGVTVFVPGTDFVSSTADTGQYLLRDLPEGTVRIAAFRGGFQGAATTDLDVQGGALTTAVDLVLLPESPTPAPGSLSGKVFVLGAANAGVQVSIYRNGVTAPAATATTGADGAFTLGGLTPDLYRLHFDLNGYPPADIPNLLVASGVTLKLNDPVVLSPFGTSNVGVDAGTPAGDDAGTATDAGTGTDAGTIGAECNTDNDCASGRLCVSNRCVGCASDASCRAGYVCRGQDCVRACTANTDCASGLVCTNGVCGACQANGDCGDPALLCLAGSCAHCRTGADCPAGRACLASGCGVCGADSDCDPGNLCVSGVCKPGACHDNSGCPATQRCDAQTLTCTTCTDDTQCSQGRICVGGTCAVGDCHDSTNCAATQACVGNLCGVCTSGTQCARASNTSYVCDTGACAAGNCVTGNDCTGANAGMACIGHVCTACTSSTDCGAGMVCDLNNRCVAGNCGPDRTCPTGQICSNNTCTGCSANSDCKSGNVCVQGLCTPGQCASQADCKNGTICNSATHLCVGCSASADCTAAGLSAVCNAGACVAGDCSFDTACPQGELCLANHCSHCAQNSDCLSSNYVCVNTLCVAGNCATQSDCNAAQQVCNTATHTCAQCTATTDCTVTAGLANTVCDTGKCVPGVCTAATVQTDCRTAGAYNGSACVQNQCVSCGSDAQCPTGDKCYGGVCQPGNCHVNSDCGQQICSNHFCSPCGTTGQQSGCDTGALCDSNHLCVAGAKCVDASGCTNGQVCSGYQCVACQSDWSATPSAAQCSSGAPLCVSGQCVTGNCHGNSDCTGSLAGSPNPIVLPYCSPTNHTCVACSASTQCPGGYVCDASSNGKCVLGNCNAFDASCATFGTSWSCVNNACQQVNPSVGPLPGGGSGTTNAEASGALNTQPSVLSGQLGLYYSYGPSNGAGERQVALDATDLHTVRWSKTETAGHTSWFQGIVIPAQGYPGGELFLTTDGNYTTYAHEGATGKVMWTWPNMGSAALGIVGSGANAVLTLAFGAYNNGHYDAFLTGADGTRQRTVSMPSCGLSTAPVFGKSLVYFLCNYGLTAIDPVANAIVWTMPWGTSIYSAQDASPVVWRSSASATSETVYFAASPSNVSGGPYEYFVVVNDGQTPSALNRGPAVTFDANSYTGPLFDTHDLGGGVAPRVIFAKSGTKQVTVTDGIGTLLAQVTTPFTSGNVSLAADGSLVGVNGTTNNAGLLTGVRIAPNPVTPTSASNVTTLWTLGFSAGGNWQTFAYPTPVATPGATLGNLLAWAQPQSLATPQIQELSPGQSAASFLPAQPVWSWFGGDPGAHRSVANFDCATNSDCPGTESCILNRCVGVCRTGDDCVNGQGCVMGQCEACVADQACGTNQKCSAGVCYANVGAGACSANSDCNASQVCVHAQCVAATTALTSPQLSSYTPYGAFTVGTDGSIYSVIPNPLNIQAWDPATLDANFSKLASWSNMALPYGSYGVPIPTVVKLGANTWDTLFVQSGNQFLFAIPGVGAPAYGGTNYSLHTAYDGITTSSVSFTGGLAQGVGLLANGVTTGPLLFSYQNGRIFALDAQQAASGTLGTGNNGNLPAVWSAATGGNDNQGPVLVPVLVGSDGTVYHFHTNGTISAWDPNGDRTASPSNGTYPGKKLWTFSAATPWAGNVGSRPAIFKGAGHDTLYFCTSIAQTLTMLDVSATTYGNYKQTSVPCGSSINPSIVIDPSGYALVAGGTTITLMAPDGSIASQLGVGQQLADGTNLTLADDGIAYLSAYSPTANGPVLTAVQISPTHQLTFLWQVGGVGGDVFDTYTFPMLVPGASAHLLADYYVSGNSGPRYFSSYSVGTSHAPMAGAWSMQGGDLQHRNSLKTQ